MGATGCELIIPFGKSPEQNQVMRGCAAELVEHGRDFADCHQVAEGAGALAQAAALLPDEQERNRHGTVGLVLSGGNVDS